MARPSSVRVRTTLSALAVVAVALVGGAFALVVLIRAAMVEGIDQNVEQRSIALKAEADAGTLAPPEAGDLDDDDPDEIWQRRDASGVVVAESQPLGATLPEESEEARVPGSVATYVVNEQELDDGGTITVGFTREEVDDTTRALLPVLAGGVPALLLLFGAVTWLVVGRSLRPVEQIRSEVEQITGDRLERRVPEPVSADEIGRLARTMNAMLERLQLSRDRQQQFVGDASHELRSPLASIRQIAEVSRAHPGAMPEGELAEVVLEEAERMQRLVEQLLVLTRADEGRSAGPPREVDLDDLALGEARRVRRTGLDVDTRDVGAGRVRGDAVALGQVARNLVDNAARHARGRIALAVRERADGVALVVDDDGPGVPAADRDRVFERFVRLDDARSRDAGGSGLGLAIVAEVVRTHAGRVEVGDSPLGGASFTVLLPADPAL